MCLLLEQYLERSSDLQDHMKFRCNHRHHSLIKQWQISQIIVFNEIDFIWAVDENLGTKDELICNNIIFEGWPFEIKET